MQSQTETANSTMFICDSCWHKCCHWLCTIHMRWRIFGRRVSSNL